MKIKEIIVESRFIVNCVALYTGVPTDIEVRDRLSVNGLISFARRAKYNSIRIFITSNDIFAWDAYTANHHQMRLSLIRGGYMAESDKYIPIEASLGARWVPSEQIRIESSQGQFKQEDIQFPILRRLIENPKTWFDGVYYSFNDPMWANSMAKGQKSKENNVDPNEAP